MKSDLVLRTELTALFAEQLGIKVPSVETDLVTAGLLDSLAMVDLLVQLEQQYQLEFSAEDLQIENFRSISRIAAFLYAHDRLTECDEAGADIRFDTVIEAS
jgi:D-alanine--poly(phosphoribitol) ligase subunit 2